MTRELKIQSYLAEPFTSKDGEWEYDPVVVVDCLREALTYAVSLIQRNDWDLPNRIEVKKRITGFDADVQLTLIWKDEEETDDRAEK